MANEGFEEYARQIRERQGRPSPSYNRRAAPVVAVRRGSRGSGSSAGEFPAPRRPDRVTTRTPGGNATSVSERIQAAKFDPQTAIDDLLASIAADYEDALAGLGRGRGGGGGGGGGGANPYAEDLVEAEEMLAEVIVNRAALEEVYADYDLITDPEEKAAIQAASQIVAENQAAFNEIAGQEQAGIGAGYDSAEAAIAEMAALIGATGAAEPVQELATEDEALRLAGAVHEAESAEGILGLTQEAARTQAVADQALDEGEIERRARLVDIEFEQMEEQVRDRIKQLREAAAAAASAAAGRRRAAASAYASERAMLDEERFQALQINPHEAGEATALAYLGQHGRNLDYNRQQLVLSTVSNAISQQVSPNQVERWLMANEIPLTSEEKNLVRNGIGAYVAGMRHQQADDRTFRATDPSDTRTPVRPPRRATPPPRPTNRRGGVS